MIPTIGARPPGASSEAQAARWVERMFAGIAPRYDFINRLLSFNIDRSWRKTLLKELTPVLRCPDAKVLDLCCGTGDVLLDLKRVAAAQVLGADFCHPMLVIARDKAAQRGLAPQFFEADALELPLAGNMLDGIAISFGFRNLANYAAGLREIERALKPGGILAILEFSHPPDSLVKAAYGFYSRFLLPIIGSLVSKSLGAYTYLPDSIRKFPKPVELRDMMRSAGFVDTKFELLTGGIAALHVGAKSAAGRIRQCPIDFVP